MFPIILHTKVNVFKSKKLLVKLEVLTVSSWVFMEFLEL